MGIKKEYTNGEVTIVWDAQKCLHSGICARGLPNVFRPKLRPWVKIEAADTETIVNQVKQCPTGALSFYMNNIKGLVSQAKEITIEALENGPLLVHGTLKVMHSGDVEEIKLNTTAFCRCGTSKTKPYCDGTHTKIDFKG